jgi:hypothetical protein
MPRPEIILCSKCSNRLQPTWLDKANAIASKVPEVVVLLVVNALGSGTDPGGLDHGKMKIHCKKCGNDEEVFW